MKTTFASIIAAVLIAGLVGCGNSERHAARQKFKEVIAAVKVAADERASNNFDSYRMNAVVFFEANQNFLDDLKPAFSKLHTLMDACKYLQTREFLYPPNREDVAAMLAIDPSVEPKLRSGAVSLEKAYHDCDFVASNYVGTSYYQISHQCALIIKKLEP